MVVTLVHEVQSAHHLGPGAAQVPAAFGPYLQYRRVVIRCRQPDRISLSGLSLPRRNGPSASARAGGMPGRNRGAEGSHGWARRFSGRLAGGEPFDRAQFEPLAPDDLQPSRSMSAIGGWAAARQRRAQPQAGRVLRLPP